MIFILLILIIIFGALFQKRLCEITGEDFHWLWAPDHTTSSKLHIALFFKYLKYKDEKLNFYGVIVQLLMLLLVVFTLMDIVH